VKRRLGLGFLVALVLTLATVGGTTAGVESQSAPAASQTIDRAYLCTNGVRAGGLRETWVSGRTAYLGEGTSTWLGRVTIGNRGKAPTRVGPDPRGRFTSAYTHWGFGIGAGEGTPSNSLDRPGLAIWSRWARACKILASKRRVPLSARGLSGGAVDYYVDGYSCPAPRKVFVRVRAVLSEATSFRLDRRSGYLEAIAPVQEGVIAVRMQSGKPFAYVSVNQSGKARIFTADRCVAD
jgi:hypothetical protein